MRLIYVNSSKVTKLEQKMNNSESFLLLLKNLFKGTYEVLLPSQRLIEYLTFDFFSDFLHFDISLLLLTVALWGVSNKHCLLPLFSLISVLQFI